MSSRIEISIVDDGLRAVAKVAPGPKASKTQLMAAIEDAGIVCGVHEVNCDKLARRLASEKFKCEDVTIAEGIPARHGEPRRLETMFEKETIVGGAEADGGTGKVDFHARSMLKPATAGQTIAMVHPAVEPANGQTVDGVDIFAHPAGHSTTLPKFSMGTAERPDGAVVATRGGIIVYREGISLEVSSYYQYKNDVDMRCGHLESCGKLKVLGAVKKGFIAAATKNLELGSVDGGSAYSRANIIVENGIRTGETAIVSAVGSINCHHVEQALLETSTTLKVEMDMVNAQVHAHDVVVGRKIIGGVIKAEHSITTTELGSESGAAMVVILGEPLQRPLECGIKGFSVAAARRLAVERRGKSMEALKRERSKMTEEEKKALKKAKILERENLERQRNRLVPEAYLDIIDTVHAGVTIKIGSVRLVLENKIQRARFKLDVENNRIIHGPLDVEASCDKRAVAGL